MKIPKKFKIFGNEIKITISEDLRKSDKYGETHYNKNEIRIASDVYEEKTIDLSITFYHELIHMILGKMSEFEKSNDEKFVQTFAELLNQAISTMEY
jgi:predicted SprT family Zn-dependent metalloprotease